MQRFDGLLEDISIHDPPLSFVYPLIVSGKKDGPEVDAECFHDVFKHHSPREPIGIIHSFINFLYCIHKYF